jgi:hypothetical protein
MNASEREVLAELERRRAGHKATVTKSAAGTTIEWDDDSETARFLKHINENQSARAGVGQWAADGRLRALAAEFEQLSDACDALRATRAASPLVTKSEQSNWPAHCPNCGYDLPDYDGDGISSVEDRLRASLEARGETL